MPRSANCRLHLGLSRQTWCALLCAVGALACEESSPPAVSDPLEPTALERRREQDDSPPPSRDEDRSVVYRISRGGTLRNVANLYKLYHHEVIALNPAMNPDQELEPETPVVVFRDSGRPSESVGYPHDGSVSHGVPMADGPGRKITAERWKTWGARETVQQLDRVLRRWAEVEPSAPPVLVGNISARGGGALAPHKSHQSGRDVDLSYITRWNGKDPVFWQHVTAENLDAELTWRLLKLLTQEARVEVIYMDRSLQKLLMNHALRHGTIRKARLPAWLEVAGDERSPLIRHVAGHKDHFHVRFACPADQHRCRS